MAGLLGLVGIVVFWIVVNLVFRAGVGTVRAAARTVSGKGSFSDNFQASVLGMNPIEVRIGDQNSDGIEAKEIFARGILPLHRSCRAGFVTSVFDKTTGQFEPVSCSLEQFQEPKTIAYQHLVEVGHVEPGVGFVGWVRVGVVLPQIIQAPYGGRRNLVAVLRLIDLDNKPDLTNGFHEPDHSGLIWQTTLSFDYSFTSIGYQELSDNRDAARVVCVKIGMAIAMWEGRLSDAEGNLIKSWIQKVLTSVTGQRRATLKETLNAALRESYAAGKEFNLSLRELTKSLQETGDEPSKYEAIELCYDLLAKKTDSTDAARIIDLVARSLELDLSELERIRDLRIVDVASNLAQQGSVEELLGIDPRWDREKVKSHLRSEFQKWNNRITALPEGTERDNAQHMLDTIAEARKKYG